MARKVSARNVSTSISKRGTVRLPKESQANVDEQVGAAAGDQEDS